MKRLLPIVFSLLFLNAIAQVADHFDDGDFTQMPAWSGSDSDFTVGPDLQLHLNAGDAGTSYLSVPSNLTSVNDCEWKFRITIDFSPSSSNYSRIYLSSDQPDLTSALNGYYLQFGESLTNDAIELFRQNGNLSTSLCRGTNGSIAFPFTASVRVLRDGMGTWKLLTDFSGGANYTLQAMGSDTTFSQAQFIGLLCTYTSGNISGFAFDDFYAGPEIPDTISPRVILAESFTSNSIEVTFSELVDNTDALDVQNYIVDQGIGSPHTIFADSLNPLKYILIFNNSFQANNQYSLQVSGVKDPAQNQLQTQDISFSYMPVAAASENDIVFSEIYFEVSSTSPLPGGEYIEIYNRKDSAVILSGWKISDGTSDGKIPDFRLDAHEYAVLYGENLAPEFISIPNAVAVTSFPTLNNDVGDRLSLLNASGDTISEMQFNDEYYHDEKKDDGGWSIERVDNDFLCRNSKNWVASQSAFHGTPGRVNSVASLFIDDTGPKIINVYPEDSTSLVIIFNEQLSGTSRYADAFRIIDDNSVTLPFSFSSVSESGDSIRLSVSALFDHKLYTLIVLEGIEDCPGNFYSGRREIQFGKPKHAEAKDVLINELLFYSNESGGDFLELINRSDKIIDLRDWVITETDYSDFSDIKEVAIITQGHRMLLPGEYLLLTRQVAKLKRYYDCLNEYALMETSSMPDFNSSEGRAVIHDDGGNEIDAFKYSDDMHFKLLSETRGVSLERMCTDVNSDNPFIWHSAAATAGFATPGYRNSQVVGLMSVGNEVSVDEEVFSPDDDGYFDVLTIRYQFPQPGTVLSLNVYDFEGRLTKKLLPGETVSSQGIITWNGLTDLGTIARAGIYVIVGKSFDLDGNEKVFRKAVFLVGSH